MKKKNFPGGYEGFVLCYLFNVNVILNSGSVFK